MFWERLKNTYHGNRLNLSIVFHGRRSPREIRRMSRDAVWNFVRNEAEYTVPGVWTGFRIEGREHLEAAMAKEKGVVIACQHLGPQRYVLPELAMLGRPVHAAMTEVFVDRCETWKARVIRDAPDPVVAEAMERVLILPVEEPTCALKMVRALRREEFVIFDVDGNIGVGGEEATREKAHKIDFLGLSVRVRTGVAYLSYRTGAPVVPIIPLWNGAGRPVLKIHAPIEAEQEEGKEAFLHRAVSEIYGILEDQLFATPEQWEMWPQVSKWLKPPAPIGSDAESKAQLEQTISDLERSLEVTPETVLRLREDDAFTLRIRGRTVFVDRLNKRFFLVPERSGPLFERLRRGLTLSELMRRTGPSAMRATLREVACLRVLNLLETPGEA